MIPEIKKILYATDFSENARYAFAHAASLANRFSAGITVLHVLEDVSPTYDSLVIDVIGEEKWKELWGQKKDHVFDSLRKRLEKFCEDVQAELPSCPFTTDEIIVKIGHPVEEIIRQADTGGCDLIVMGSHGRGVIAGAIIGSTSARVLRRSKKPVLVIRLPEKEEE